MDRDFYLADNTSIKLPTMYQKGTFRYAEVLNLDCKVRKLTSEVYDDTCLSYYKTYDPCFQMLEMPYKGNFSFLIFLPNSNNGVPALVEKLVNPSVFYDAYDSMTSEQVEVYIPKFNITTEMNLSGIMKQVEKYSIKIYLSNL